MAGVIQRILPAKYWTQLQSIRSRNNQIRWLKKYGVLEIGRRFSEANGVAVLHGPFAGMKYPAESILTRHSTPMLLGSYERELHQIIERALVTRYHAVVDVGSAEGYYAVGFALKGQSPVITFETDVRELKLCQEMARLNGVGDRVTVRRWCSPEALRVGVAGTRCFVLSDCEGYEKELFDEMTVKVLEQSDVLIELHDDAYQPLLERFSRTHTVQTIAASPRLASDYPELACLGEDAARAVAEYRLEGQRWLYARARIE